MFSPTEDYERDDDAPYEPPSTAEAAGGGAGAASRRTLISNLLPGRRNLRLRFIVLEKSEWLESHLNGEMQDRLRRHSALWGGG